MLSGGQALGFVRSRHTFATQDLQRIQNQRIFLQGAAAQADQHRRDPQPVLGHCRPPPASPARFTVDNGTSLYQLLQVAFALRNPITTTVPIANSNYVTSNGQDALLLNSTGAQGARDRRSTTASRSPRA